MIKISALNTESDKDDDLENVSKEMLEHIAFKQYKNALDLQSGGQLNSATRLYKDLLDTELLSDVRERSPCKESSSQLRYLKYLCLKNLASILSSTDKLEEAIKAYSAASDLDDTDVSLWHRFGLVCIQAKRFEMALYAFQRGVERNPRHWPCLDKIVTLLLGLDYNEQCIETIHETLKLDPHYLRGLVYRRHIYTIYKHMREYMEYLNPVYKWKEEEDNVPIDEERAKVLLKEAEVTNDAYVEQQEAEKFVYMVPNVTLKKPITRWTWESVGDSLVHMHHYMTEHCFSHACPILLPLFLYCQSQPEYKDQVVEMEVFEEKNNNYRSVTEECINKVSKEEAACIKVKSNILYGAKKTRKQRTLDKKPFSVCGVTASQKRYKTFRHLCKNISFHLNIDKIFDDLHDNNCDEEYFGTESEQNDVKEFIKKYTENRKDIIDLLNDYLSILSCKWKKRWPTGLSKIFIEANTCYSTHIDIPAFVNDNYKELLHYTRVNLLVEEFLINEKLKEESAELASSHKLSVIDSIEIILTVNPQIFSSVEYVELVQRMLRVKILIHIVNKNEDLALESLYQLHYEAA